MFCFQGESPPNNIRIDSLLHLMYQKNMTVTNEWLSTGHISKYVVEKFL